MQSKYENGLKLREEVLDVVKLKKKCFLVMTEVYLQLECVGLTNQT